MRRFRILAILTSALFFYSGTGFFYAYADDNALPQVVVQSGHVTSIFTIAVSGDGRFFLTAGGYELTVKAWDIASGTEIRGFSTSGFCTTIAISPDCKYALTGTTSGDPDQSVELWDIATGKKIRTFTGITDYINDAVFSPDGKYILSSDDRKNMKMWAVSTGELVRVFKGNNEGINALAFSPDGGYAVSGSSDKMIKLWDISTGNEIKSFTGHAGSLKSLSFSPDGRCILSTSSDGTAKLWDLSTGREIRTFSCNSEPVLYAEFFSDGKMAACVTGNAIRLFNISDGKEIKIIPVQATNGGCAKLMPSGKSVLVADKNMVRLWDIASGQVLREFRSHISPVKAVAFSPDAKYMLSGTDKTINLWDFNTCKKIRTFTGHTDKVNSAVFSPDSCYILSGADDGTVKLWDIASGKLVRTFTGHSAEINSVAFSPDGKYAISGSDDGTLKLWDIASGNNMRTFESDSRPVLSAAFSPDGRYIYAGFNSMDNDDYEAEKGNSAIWDLESGEIIQRFTGLPGEVYAVAFSPDGKYVASAEYDLTIRISDVATGRAVKILSGHKIFIYSLAFSPDGKYILSGSHDFTIKLWDIESEKELKTFYGHSNMVNSVAFSPDGKTILSGSFDGAFRIWNVETGEWISLMQHLNGKDWLIFDSDGYWDSSRYGGDLVAMVKDMDCWKIDQFAVRNNRPDIILAKLPEPDRKLIGEYHRQYLKRIRKIEKLYGIKETDLSSGMHVPVAGIIRSEQDDKTMAISIKLTDSMYNIVSYNVYVNDVPLYTGLGRKVNRAGELEVSEKIELINGKNKIEVSCFNEKGAESYRAVTNASCEKSIRGNLYFIGFGVADYEDSSICDLMYSENDVEDLARKFSGMTGEYDHVYIKTYTGKDVTPGNIRAAKDFLKDSCVDDTVILFISGHGMHDNDEYKTYYYITQNTRLKDLKNTAANFETIEDLLSGIKPGKKLFLMDTCDSGELDDFSANDSTVTGSRGNGKGTARTPTGQNIKTVNGRGYFDRGRYIYNDLFRRTGAIVFSSSMGGEVSWEFDDFENGAFTEALLEGLNGRADADGNGKITMDELQDYVNTTVNTYTEGKQHPVIDRDNIFMQFELPVK